MLLHHVVASVALLATTGISANALQNPLEAAGEHTLRSIETSLDAFNGDLQGGCATGLRTR